MNEPKAYPLIGIPGAASIELGKVVRAAWVEWAKQQPDPVKASWLTPWDELDDGQQEVDILIGQAVAEHIRRPLPDLMGKQKIARLEDRIIDQATVINALNRSVAQLMNHVRLYAEASKAVLDKYNGLHDDFLESWDGMDSVKAVEMALVQLRQVATTKQAVDMGPYEAVDFVRLASSYIELREKAQAAYEGWKKGDDVVGPLNELKTALNNYPTPDCMPINGIELYPVQVTSIAITQNVKELVAMLEPDARVEAIVYDKGKAAITDISAKLALLNQSVADFLYNYPYQNTPGDPMAAYHRLCRTFDRINRSGMMITHQGDPVGDLTRRLRMMQIAAYYVLDTWNGNSNRINEALDGLKLAMKQTGSEAEYGQPGKTATEILAGYERQGTGYDPGARGHELQGRQTRPDEDRTPTEGKDLQAKDTYCSK